MTPEFLTNDVKSAIASHCNLTPHQEACGIVLLDGTVIPSENMIEGSGLSEGGVELDRTTGVLIDDELILEHEESICAVFHSHWDEATSGYLSFTDIEQSRFHQIPYLLYHTEFKVWDYFDPMYPHPYPLLEKSTSKTNINYYLGWPFEFGRSDCSMLLRAYFKNVLNHEIPDYPRPRNGEWYKDPQFENAYLNLFNDPANGFKQVNTATPKKNDVVLMRMFGSRHPCHTGIMITDETMLHLIQPGHLSEVVVWGGAWKRGLHSVWRLAKK